MSDKVIGTLSWTALVAAAIAALHFSGLSHTGKEHDPYAECKKKPTPEEVKHCENLVSFSSGLP